MKLGEAEYSADVLNSYMSYYSEWLGGPSNLLQTIAQKESSYNPVTGSFRNVCNSVRACGLFQLRPIALADIKRVYGYDLDPLDPIQATIGATLLFLINARYLARYVPQLTWPILIVAYNGGRKAGYSFYRYGYAPSNESRNYLAFVAARTGIA